jgi:hypothetical protein
VGNLIFAIDSSREELGKRNFLCDSTEGQVSLFFFDPAEYPADLSDVAANDGVIPSWWLVKWEGDTSLRHRLTFARQSDIELQGCSAPHCNCVTLCGVPLAESLLGQFVFFSCLV